MKRRRDNREIRWYFLAEENLLNLTCFSCTKELDPFYSLPFHLNNPLNPFPLTLNI